MERMPVYLGRKVSREQLEQAVHSAARQMKLKVEAVEATKPIYLLEPVRSDDVYDKTSIKLVKPVRRGLRKDVGWFLNIEFSLPFKHSDTDTFFLQRMDRSSLNSVYDRLVLTYLTYFSESLKSQNPPSSKRPKEGIR